MLTIAEMSRPDSYISGKRMPTLVASLLTAFGNSSKNNSCNWEELDKLWFSNSSEKVYAWVDLLGDDLYVGSATQHDMLTRWGQEIGQLRKRWETPAAKFGKDRFYGRIAKAGMSYYVPIPIAMVQMDVRMLETSLIRSMQPSMNTRDAGGQRYSPGTRHCDFLGAGHEFCCVA